MQPRRGRRGGRRLLPRHHAASWNMGFPTFSYGRYAQDQAPRGKVIDFRCRIEIGGVRVHPGDIVFGDIDGVCIVPREAEEEVIAKALEKARGEKTSSEGHRRRHERPRGLGQIRHHVNRHYHHNHENHRSQSLARRGRQIQLDPDQGLSPTPATPASARPPTGRARRSSRPRRNTSASASSGLIRCARISSGRSSTATSTGSAPSAPRCARSAGSTWPCST